MIELIAQLDRGIIGRLERDRGIEAIAFEVAILAERIAVFIKRIQTHGDVFIDRLTCVERDALVAVGSGLHHGLVDPRTVGFLQCPVDQPAAGAAAEDQRARPFEDFEALRVVEIPEILDVVTEAIDEEIGAGIDTTDHEFVAVALALMDGDAWNVARHLRQALKALIPDEFLAHDGDRLRNIHQRRVGLGRRRRAVGVNPGRAGTRVLRLTEALWCGLRFDVSRCLRPAPLPCAVGALHGHHAGAAFYFGSRNLDRWKLRSELPLLRCRGLCLGCRRGDDSESYVADGE